MGEELFAAADGGDVQKVKAILDNNPRLNVNWKRYNAIFPTALHIACYKNHPEIVALLLAYPGIDVNQTNDYLCSPVNTACIMGHTSCVRLLLEDNRVDVSRCPYYGAVVDGHLETIKCFIASGRQMDLGNILDYKRSQPLDWQMSSLLRKFKDHPDETRYQVRLELGCLDKLSADIFSLVVFLCDDLLQLKNRDVATITTAHTSVFPTVSPTRNGTVKFLTIMGKLPMELQMIICHRVVGSAGMNISSRTAEFAFRQLAKVYTAMY